MTSAFIWACVVCVVSMGYMLFWLASLFSALVHQQHNRLIRWLEDLIDHKSNTAIVSREIAVNVLNGSPWFTIATTAIFVCTLVVSTNFGWSLGAQYNVSKRILFTIVNLAFLSAGIGLIKNVQALRQSWRHWLRPRAAVGILVLITAPAVFGKQLLEVVREVATSITESSRAVSIPTELGLVIIIGVISVYCFVIFVFLPLIAFAFAIVTNSAIIAVCKLVNWNFMRFGSTRSIEVLSAIALLLAVIFVGETVLNNHAPWS